MPTTFGSSDRSSPGCPTCSPFPSSPSGTGPPADRAVGVRNLASALGERRAIIACWLATLSAPLFAAGVVAALVAFNAALYVVRRRLGVMACSPCVAVATALLGLGWVLGVKG